MSIVLSVSWVGARHLSRGGGEHDSRRQAAVLVVRVQGQAGDTGQRGAVLQAVWMDVRSRRLHFWCCHRCGGVIPGVGPRSVGPQLRVVHELRGNAGLAGMSQSILHCPLQLHPPVLEPVSDLERKGNAS